VVNLRIYRVQSYETTFAVTIEPRSKRAFCAKVKSEIIECICDDPGEISTWAIRHREVKVHARARSLGSNRIEIWVGGLPFLFTVTPMGIEDIQSTQSRAGEDSGDIHASMPGRITSILVKSGEEVSVGSPLVVLEAMKMQNEIVSHKSGHVTSIRVKEGATVRKDDLLVQIR